MSEVFTIISVIIQILSFIINIFVLIFKLANKLRLTIPLIYYMLLCCIPSLTEWAKSHPELAIGILIFLVVLSALSWLYTLIKYIKNQLNTTNSINVQHNNTGDIAE